MAAHTWFMVPWSTAATNSVRIAWGTVCNKGGDGSPGSEGASLAESVTSPFQALSTAGRISVAKRSAVSPSKGAAVSMMKFVTPMRFHSIISSVIRSTVVT